jgi:hypothetical protein
MLQARSPTLPALRQFLIQAVCRDVQFHAEKSAAEMAILPITSVQTLFISAAQLLIVSRRLL